jgi:hypothetical protein
MSETAQTLIKAALRSIGAIATGETPTAAELADGLEAMRFMLRSWSSQNIRIPFTTTEPITLSGATSYSWGSGGTIATARPVQIHGAYTTDNIVDVIDEAQYRRLVVANQGGPVQWLWYQPQYPLGYLFPWPLDSSTLYVHSTKELTDPTLITSTVSFPTGYDDAIKWNLAVRLAPEYGKEASATVSALAATSLHAIETLNFSMQIPEARVDILGMSVGEKHNIDAG